METLFLVCAIVGGTLLICQVLLGMLGIGGGHHDADGHDGGVEHDTHHGDHHDHENDHGGAWYFGWLTFRTIVSALTFFGLAGMTARSQGNTDNVCLAVAAASGLGAMLLVGALMRSLNRLKADGTVHLERVVGKAGSVYLSIPGSKAGTGKVLVNVQNRTVEYLAVTAHADTLPTGSSIIVVSHLGGNRVEVAPAPLTEKIGHA